MAKSKKLVMLNSNMDNLDDVIRICLRDDKFEAKNAQDFISSTMGYQPIKVENPYSDLLEKVNTLLEHGFDITTKVHEANYKVDIEKSVDYLNSIKQRFDDLMQQDEILSKQANDCQSGIDKYKHFVGLNIELGKIFECEFISMRFGYLKKDAYTKLRSLYADNPYIMFRICSEDENGYWGAYFAPKDKIKEVDSIFVILNFDRLYIPGAVGTVEEIIKNFEHNLEIIKGQMKEIEDHAQHILEEESGEIISLYFALLSLELISENKRHAVKNEKDAFFVGTIPLDYEKEFTEKFKNIPDMFINVEKIKISKKQKKLAN